LFNKTKQFIEVPSFQDVLNPSINHKTKQILSRFNYTTESTYYHMVEFKNGQFINTNSFGWYPADTYEDSIQNANQLMRCVEEISSNDGSKTVVKDFYVPKISNDIDINDEQLKPYFEEGSFWDLSGHKWKDYMLLNELKY